MSLQTPTISEINQNIIAQLEATLNQSIPLLPKSLLRVLARVFAGVFILLYKYGGFIFLQMFVQTASDQDTTIHGEVVNPLDFWGVLIGEGPRGVATQAELLIDITVNNQSGFLQSGTQLTSVDNGVTYITIGSVALDSSVVQATVLASSDQSGGGGAGAIGNLPQGAILSFVNAPANVARNAAVGSQTVTGADAENTDLYRQKVIDRFQRPPQGGAYSDYATWALDTPGIINVYPYTGVRPGEVDIYTEATTESSGNPDGIPTAAQLQAVLDNINFVDSGLASRRPITVFPNSNGITRKGFNVTITGIADVDDLAQTETDIENAIEQYFFSVQPFIVGLTVPPREDRITNTRISSIVEDIVNAAGGFFTSSEFEPALTPGAIAFYQLLTGEKAKVVAISFVP